MSVDPESGRDAERLKIAVIVDGDAVPRYVFEALKQLDGCGEIIVFSCANTTSRKNVVKHWAYYVLNLFSVRNQWTTKVKINELPLRRARTIVFDSVYDGAWQALPDAVLETIEDSGIDVILKFGMNLLRIPTQRTLPPILSYHHGDPSLYRGRPAGFWELINGQSAIGQMVQVLSNALDAGQIVAYGETKVYPHSYRATLVEAYRHSPLLLKQALRNIRSGERINRPTTGPNYRLPSNGVTLRLMGRLLWKKVQRLFYGAFYEKRWRVSVAPTTEPFVSKAGVALPASETWRTLTPPGKYIFYADPFFSNDPPGILVEGLNRWTGLGEILLVDEGRERRISPPGGHYSYPCPIEVAGRQMLLPEVAEWSHPRLFSMESGHLREEAMLRLEPGAAILDPTTVERNGTIYLFGNVYPESTGALSLWSAASIDATFVAHPCSPVRISPEGSRMAGKFLSVGGDLFRLGQDATGSYGDGILVFAVEELSETGYREALIGKLKLSDRSGPHTVNMREGAVVFDWYFESFSLLAGVRRLLSQLYAKAASRLPRADSAG
ncbi:MAG TPA: hypothetical protein VF655_04055 [Allosphingosinicella sp.]|jgi:hypothetical protein